MKGSRKIVEVVVGAIAARLALKALRYVAYMFFKATYSRGFAVGRGRFTGKQPSELTSEDFRDQVSRIDGYIKDDLFNVGVDAWDRFKKFFDGLVVAIDRTPDPMQDHHWSREGFFYMSRRLALLALALVVAIIEVYDFGYRKGSDAERQFKKDTKGSRQR